MHRCHRRGAAELDDTATLTRMTVGISDSEVARLLQRQVQVARVQQLVAAGLTRKHILSQVAARPWQRYGDHCVVTHNYTPTRYLDCEWILPDGSVVALEIDGAHHMEVEHWENDMKRERGVVISGRRVLRATANEARYEQSELAADLEAIGVPRLVRA